LYEKEFFEDLKSLNCQRPPIVLRVTKHIPEIIKFILELVKADRAYVVESGSVYFNTQKFTIKSLYEPSQSETASDSKGLIRDS
jgi:cysteinyl-tRNA synthetase